MVNEGDHQEEGSPPDPPRRPNKRRRMEDQSEHQESYARPRGERRQSSYHSAGHSRLPQTQSLLSDLSLSRQSGSASTNFPHPGSLSHAPYDPVHDSTYNLPPMPSGHQSGAVDPYGAAAFPRDDRALPHYGYGTRDDVHFRPAALPRLDESRRDRLQYTPSHELESLSYRAPSHPASQGMHSFRVQATSHGTDPRSSYPSALPETPGGYPNLPPLTVPSASTEERTSGKRIVMACHQCRARKIRCDAERPSCKNCVRRREECKYDDKPKRRGPDKVPGSRMRSCKSKKQGGENSPSDGPSGSGGFFPA